MNEGLGVALEGAADVVKVVFDGDLNAVALPGRENERVVLDEPTSAADGEKVAPSDLALNRAGFWLRQNAHAVTSSLHHWQTHWMSAGTVWSRRATTVAGSMPMPRSQCA